MEGNRLKPYEWNDESTEWSIGMYERFNNLKQTAPHIKTLLSVGGWTFGTPKMTAMLATAANRAEFIATSIVYLRERNFDGFDLDFEYPGSRGSPPEDKYRYTELVVETRAAFEREAEETGRERLLLTAGVPAGKDTIDAGYEVDIISKHLDFLNLMTYDYNGGFDKHTGMNSPLHKHPEEFADYIYFNVEFTTKYWIELGADPSKLCLGMPLYGRGSILSDPAQNGFRAPTTGSSPGGPFTREAGFYSYYEVCDMLAGDAKREWEDYQKTPYLYNNQRVWASYDDYESLAYKVEFMKSLGLAGLMVWSLDLDDFRGQHCDDAPYPLLTEINKLAFTNSNVTLPPVPSTTTTPKPDITVQESTTKEHARTTAAHKITTTSIPPVSGNDCTGRPDGLYSHPETCTKFVQCAGGEAHVQDCPGGLLFNPTAGGCDWPHNLSEEEQQRCAGLAQ